MKRTIATVLTLTLCLSLAGCGKESNSSEAMTDQAGVQDVASWDAEDLTLTEDTEQIESDTEAEAETDELDKMANAEEKFQRLNDAYWEMQDGTNHHGALFLEVTQNNCEMLTSNYDIEKGELEMYTADGNRLSTTNGVDTVLEYYYYNKINNNSEWYDISEWVSQFATEDDMIKQFSYFLGEADSNTDFMNGVVMYASTISKDGNVTFGEADYDIDHYKFSNGVVAAYTMPIIIDGNDYGLDAVFDEEGNLINIWDFDTNGDYSFQRFIWEDSDHKN